MIRLSDEQGYVGQLVTTGSQSHECLFAPNGSVLHESTFPTKHLDNVKDLKGYVRLMMESLKNA